MRDMYYSSQPMEIQIGKRSNALSA